DRIIEYDVDKLVCEERTDFQKVEIYHTKSFGNMLVLDDLQSKSCGDLPYTHGLIDKGNRNMKEKEILILGGGDGGPTLGSYLRKPKFVTMI
ncbi:Spermine synthase-like, partial [Homarus americanus]